MHPPPISRGRLMAAFALLPFVPVILLDVMPFGRGCNCGSKYERDDDHDRETETAILETRRPVERDENSRATADAAGEGFWSMGTAPAKLPDGATDGEAKATAEARQFAELRRQLREVVPRFVTEALRRDKGLLADEPLVPAVPDFRALLDTAIRELGAQAAPIGPATRHTDKVAVVVWLPVESVASEAFRAACDGCDEFRKLAETMPTLRREFDAEIARLRSDSRSEPQ